MTSNLGKLIRKARRMRDLTQEEVAQMAGISRSLVASIETGISTPSLATLKKIALALDIPSSELSAALLIESKQEAPR
ncbi:MULTISPECIES: helix-turn-helix transcriptional regulator [unclassified Meiothermus]|uniref:helix-turn-helix transcriptional regulator n=1 Tax=unclassified Meiothermus TaxID=370471 RepID=UPI000D7BA8A2|nr:transcriptional regulator [Meiothermus sp. Pnk-1]RYM40761.1 XRE family transcriptional regulator [Meiothermus sp. PNK-Is4]